MSHASSRLLAVTTVAAFLAFPGPALATYHTFVINEVFSSADGKIQFVELLESAPDDPYYGSSGGNGQNLWAGKTLVSASGASQRTFTFPSNLPSPLTAGKSVLVGTQSFAALGAVTPDFIGPDGFLFTTNGSVNYASVDAITYGSLPTDGVSSLERGGQPASNTPTNFAGLSAHVTATAVVDGVVEFYNTGLNHFFLTANGVEAASIDAGGSGPGWNRTGNVFKSGGTNAVCRFYGVQAAGGPNGHF